MARGPHRPRGLRRRGGAYTSVRVRAKLATGAKRCPARRWVVERTLGWLSKCRALLVRYDEKAGNFLGLIRLACALLRYRRLRRLAGDLEIVC